MDITWVSNETPDRHGQGGQRRQYFQIRTLRDAGHLVTVITLDGPQDDTSVGRLADVHRLQAPEALRGRVSLPWRRRQWRQALARRADAVVVAHIESWPRFAWALPDGVPTILDLHNVFSRWHRLAGRKEKAATWEDTERRACAAADAVSVLSEREASGLPDTTTPIIICDNGIDPSEWPSEPRPADQPTLKLFGNWGWAPNTQGLAWFVGDVWPRVHAVTGATCQIAGAGVDPDLLAPGSGLTAHGRVPDLHTFLADAWAVAVPVKDGVGAPVKYAESLAVGVPVMATFDGAPMHRALATVSDDPDMWVDVLTRWLDPSRTPAVLTPDDRAERLALLSWATASKPLAHWLDSLR